MALMASVWRAARGGRVVISGLAAALISFGLFSPVAAERAGMGIVVPDTAHLVDYSPNPHLDGRLTIAGSDTMKPLLLRLASDFQREHPKVKIAVEGRGSSEAIREFTLGISSQRRGDKARGDSGHEGAAQVTLLASSRELTIQERDRFSSRFGYEPLSIPIALDAVAIYVHRSNPIQSLTLAQLDSIFSSTFKRGGPDITTWEQLGLESLAGQPIHLHGRDKKSGTHDFFQSAVLQNGALKESVSEEPGSASEVLAIARDPLAIGYAGVGFQISEVRVVPLVQESGGMGILPSAESVASGSYPLNRALFLYANQDLKAKFDPVLLEFLTYVNSSRGQETVIKANAYPLSQAMIAKNLELLTGFVRTAFSPRAPR